MKHPMAVLACMVAAVAVARPAAAIPAFARRYQVECHFCHEGFPKLNAMGQRFRERGLRMEQEDNFDASKWLRSVPVTGRAEYNHTFVEKGDGFGYGFLKGIAAGSLGPRVAFWVDDGVTLADGDFSHTKPDNAWLRLEVVTGGALYARGGRLELDLPFTQARTPHLIPYEIYTANTGFETDNIGEYQDGVEVGGSLPQDVHWSAAVVKGRNSASAVAASSDAGKFDANLFLRLAKRIQRHRIGAFAYIGRNTLVNDQRVAFGDDLLRVGADASVWIEHLNFYGVYLYGRNSNSTGSGRELTYSGGFLQGDYHLHDNVALTLRLSVVNQPPPGTEASRQTFSAVLPGIQLFILDHGKLSFEYAFQNKDRGGFGSIQAEVAF